MLQQKPSSENTTTVTIPLKYTYLTAPIHSSSKGNTILYESSTSKTTQTIWNQVEHNLFDQLGFRLTPGSRILDNLSSLRRIVSEINSSKHQIGVSAQLVESRILDNTLTVILNGPDSAVMEARSKVLSVYTRTERRHIGISNSRLVYTSISGEESDDTEITRVPDSDSFQSHSKLNSKLQMYLDRIAEYCSVSVFVTDFFDKVPYGVNYHAESMSEEAAKPNHIFIFGSQDSVRFAELKIRIVLESIAGNYVDFLSTSLSLHPLLAGPNKVNFEYIMLQTHTRIYTPDWLPEVYHSNLDGKNRNLDEIYIAGSESQVLLAKRMLTDILARTCTLYQDCVLTFAKADLFALRFQEKLRTMMLKEGSFIQIPFLGATRPTIRVQASNPQACSRTVAQVMELAGQLYDASFAVHTGEDNGQGIYIQPNTNVGIEYIDKISAASGATITCKGTCFDIIGFKSDTKRAISMLNSLPVWKVSPAMIIFNDFLC